MCDEIFGWGDLSRCRGCRIDWVVHLQGSVRDEMIPLTHGYACSLLAKLYGPCMYVWSLRYDRCTLRSVSNVCVRGPCMSLAASSACRVPELDVFPLQYLDSLVCRRQGVIRFRGRYVRLLKYMGAALVTTHCKLYSTHVVDCRLIAVCSRWSDCCVTFCCRKHVLLLAVRKGKVGNVGPKRGLSGTTRRCSGGGDCRFVRGEGNGNSRIDTYKAYN